MSVGRVYSVSIGTPTAISAAFDPFEVRCTASCSLQFIALELFQTTVLTDANEFIAQVELVRGIGFTSGSGGETPTPVPMRESDVAASFGADARNTTQASAGTRTVLHSDGWNLRTPYLWVPPEDCRPVVDPGATDGFIVTCSDPGTSVTIGGTLYVMEIGT